MLNYTLLQTLFEQLLLSIRCRLNSQRSLLDPAKLARSKLYNFFAIFSPRCQGR